MNTIQDQDGTVTDDDSGPCCRAHITTGGRDHDVDCYTL